MKKIAFVLFILESMMLFSQSTGDESFFPDLRSNIGKHFPIEILKNEKGENYTSDYLVGKITFVNFWFTACAPCIEEMPLLNKLKEQNNEDVSFIAITFDTSDKVKNFLADHQFNFQHITSMDKSLGSLAKRYPMSIIIDREGNIARILKKVDEDYFDFTQKQINSVKEK